MSRSASPDTVGAPTQVGKRATVLLFGFFLWGVVIVGRLADFMVFSQAEHLAGIARDSLFEGSIPALRGRILDHTGRPLAWSTRHFALHWRVPQDESRALTEWLDLEQRAGGLASAWSRQSVHERLGEDIVLNADMPRSSVGRVAALCSAVPRLRLRCYFERHRLPELDSESALSLGTVATVEGNEIGVSGMERTHDALLRGRPGTYHVMLDRTGEWIPATWRTVRELCPGYDVHLSIN